ncbi:hypothetical protein MDMS009_1721 [Methylophaga thiooxydans DMS010]|uniref:Uncharacterized protein n=1 Tax=Methylophaga thiooxydans DMS010 TaxID=637616 RepID=C0N7U7_9GAMM|nr:hypothetical protein MDMS009_1721 [Methylophaga thiooxydans DMS010]
MLIRGAGFARPFFISERCVNNFYCQNVLYEQDAMQRVKGPLN